jgi:hypothetical protein
MIPSLLQIPSAVSDSKLHSVLPNNGKGDFTFDRSTGATRINRDGLIEEVGYFSSELVQNGNFSELGSELVTNGDFADNSWWQLSSSNVNISNGKGNFTAGTTEYFYKTNTLTIGKAYKVTFEITDYTTGYISSFGGNYSGAAVGVGTYVRYINNCVNTTFGLVGNTFRGSIDNVSVKQVDPNDRWTKSNGSTISEDVATVVALGDIGSTPNNWTLYQAVFEQNKTYKVTFKARQKSGSGTFQAGRDYYLFIDEVITSTFTEYSFIIDSGSLNFTGRLTFGGRTSGNEFEVDNISLVEIQGDRPRLSYDITNGVVEDKPHLLLEPSRTNLVTHSNDTSTYSHYDYGGGLIVDSYGYLSPDGTQNASRLVYTNSSTGSGGALLTQNITLNATGTYTISLYAKSISGTKRIRISPKNTGSQGTAGFIINMTSEWQRFTHTFTNDGGTSRGFQFRITETEDSGDRTFDVWGMTIEEGSFATSVIPTAGTTITRAAETCNNSKPSVNSTEGVLYCEIAALTDLGSYRLISLSDGTLNQRISILYDITDNKIYGQCVNSTTQAFIPFVPTSISNMNKIAFKYKANDFALWVNGVEVGVDTSGVIPTGLDKLSFDRGDGVDDWYGKVKGLAVYNEALSESQLMQLTGVTASSIYNNFVTRTASFTVEALNEVKKVIDNL